MVRLLKLPHRLRPDFCSTSSTVLVVGCALEAKSATYGCHVGWLQVFPQLTSVMVTPLVSALSRYESLKAEEDRKKVSREQTAVSPALGYM